MAKIIAIDFDGTCVKHSFPKIGEDIGAAPVLRSLVDSGHLLILWTVRSNKQDPDTQGNPELSNIPGDYLTQAEEWFVRNNIPLWGVQKNPTQHHWSESPKAYSHLLIDDTGLGIPLIRPKEGRPYVDWEAVDKMLYSQGYLTDEASKLRQLNKN